MPPAIRRRWASRRPRLLRKRGKKQSNKQHTKPKVPHKPRLVRRYKRRKTDDNARARPATLKHPVSTSSAKGLPPKVAGAEANNDVVADHKTAVTSVPNPTPETGITPPANTVSNTVGAGSPLLGTGTFDTATSGLSIINPTSVAPITNSNVIQILHTVTPLSSFSALPPLQSLAPTSLATVGVRPAAIPTTSRPMASASSTPNSVDSTPRQLSVALVILVSVGSALFLLGFCIVVKMCARPRKRPRPTPSLPVINGGDTDEDFYETKESPMFGGEERMSAAMAANGPTWNWVQYPHTKLSGPTAPPVQFVYQPQGQGHQHQMYSVEPVYADPRFNLAARGPPSPPPANMHQTPDNPPGRFVPQNVAATSAAKRISRQSLSFYAPTNAESPLYNIREETALTGDGNDVIKRSRAKTASRRLSQPAFEDRKHRNSTVSFAGLAYDGDDAMSPAPVDYNHVIQDTPVLNSDFAGRARVKSGYFATGTYPRMSTLPTASYSIATATRINVGQRNSFSKDKLAQQQKGSAKRARDTQALTYALGLASPRPEYAGMSSPQPTLYPDDSVSVVDGRRLKKSASQRRGAEAVPDVPVIVPTTTAGGSSDTLMGMEFGVSQMSLSGLALGPVSEGEEDQDAEPSVLSSSSSRSVQGSRGKIDKAPRVPSPPSLPSLAQMGLARNNPEAYDNYRSPTYSLYGLYQTADRKSYVGR